MFRSPSRSQRSKGIKARHVLQITLLVAVCFWLIYQVKHSHDRKKELDETNAKISESSSDVTLKFGRKDIRPREEETGLKIEKHEGDEKEEEEEEENKHEEEEDMRTEKHEGKVMGEEETGGEEENKNDEEMKFDKHDVGETEEEETGGEENKHEEDEQEEEGKTEEKEDEEKGVEEDELDERDQEKPDMEVEHEEDSINEEKEREEGDENESKNKEDDKEGQTEEENSDHDGVMGNAHGAREEQYKADDASSAVAHDVQAITTETEKENSNENNGTIILEPENKVNITEEISIGQNTSMVTVGDGEMAENGTSLSETVNEENTKYVITSNSNDTSLLNSTIVESIDIAELSNNSSEVSTDNNSASLHNGTESESAALGPTSAEGSDLKIDVLEQVNNVNISSDSNQSDSNSTTSTVTENTIETTGENVTKLEPVLLDTSRISNTSADSNSSESSERTENTDATENEQSDTGNGTDGTDGISDSSVAVAEVQHDPIDSSIHLEEKEVRTDLDTLPEIQTEGSSVEETAAE